MNDDLHHLAGAYALDALDDNERLAFEAHYATCDICAEEVQSFQEAAFSLADGASTEPPPNLKRQVMAQVAQTRQVGPVVIDLSEARNRRRPNMRLIATAIAAACIVVAGIFGAQVLSNGSDTDDLIAAPDAVVTTLEGETGNLEVVWSAERDQVAIIGSDLGALDEGTTYELWFVNDDGVAKAALFKPDNGEVNDIFDVDDVDPSGFGVTIEPDGGSDQPTSDILYLGEI